MGRGGRAVRVGWGTCMWEVGWGVDGTGGVMSSGGRWARDADSPRRDAGKGGGGGS